jgi:hypothetical protein
VKDKPGRGMYQEVKIGGKICWNSGQRKAKTGRGLKISEE